MTIAQNLQRLRSRAGLTQKAAADAAGVSLSAYRTFETGRRTPTGAQARALATALDAKVADLYAEIRLLTAVRFRSRKAMRKRAVVLAAVAEWIERYRAIEALEQDPLPVERFNRLRLVASETRHAGPEALAQAVRKEMGLDDGEPVRDVCGLLEAKGVRVLGLPLESDAFSGLSVAESDGGPAVAVNTADFMSEERRLFTAAHELAHLLLHLDAFDVMEMDEPKDDEKEADRFASAFLMPRASFYSEWDDARGLDIYDRVMKVKGVFGVSARSVVSRAAEGRSAHDQKLLWATFNARRQAREGDATAKREPMPLPKGSAFVPDRLARLVRSAVEADRITVSRAAEILDLRIDDMRERVASWCDSSSTPAS